MKHSSLSLKKTKVLTHFKEMKGSSEKLQEKLTRLKEMKQRCGNLHEKLHGAM